MPYRVIAAVCGGVFFLASLPALFNAHRHFFLREEPFYAYPVELDGGTARLRSDSYGEGHYGASRNGGRTHQGIDLSAALGVPIFASKSGRVSAAEQEKGYGLYVEIVHPDGLVTRYAHLSEIVVKAGEWVWRWQRIGSCGKTGNARYTRIEAHLHFEIRSKTHALDPMEGLLDPSVLIQGGKL